MSHGRRREIRLEKGVRIVLVTGKKKIVIADRIESNRIDAHQQNQQGRPNPRGHAGVQQDRSTIPPLQRTPLYSSHYSPSESDGLLVAKEIVVTLGPKGRRPRPDPLEPGESFLHEESLPPADLGQHLGGDGRGAHGNALQCKTATRHRIGHKIAVPDTRSNTK